ncbi:MAG: hypothetical protein HZB43_11375 [candidate division Zixibacteria bacterium]|nr:hypothetical protein [candidate division Zixibacteria bacterium]
MELTDIIASSTFIVIPLLMWAISAAIRKGRTDPDLQSAKDTPGTPSEPKIELPEVHWLLGEDSPTGRKVLDCRAYALGVHLTTQDKAAAEKFAVLTLSDGSELEGKSPDNSWLVDVDWEFEYDQLSALTAGMRAQTTEDLWMIDFRDDRLYFRRSWTGQLVFMTNFHMVPTVGAEITRIWVTDKDQFGKASPEYAAAYVRHLIDTHLLGILTPFPIPPDFPENEKEIASFVFHSVGRRGWLAEYFSNAWNDSSDYVESESGD